ncbi:transposase [Legionella cincinnatiensis]|uniref:transposase n=1 Tax=Legionella cincinnatiensis TaxID=28085 RepID=UPI003B75CEFE
MSVQNGAISYELKTLHKNGTTHVIFEPLDFITRLAALVLKLRVHFGVFAPKSRYRAQVTSENKEKSDNSH